MVLRRLVALLLALSAAACATPPVAFWQVKDSPRPLTPRAAKDVEVFDGLQPEKPHVEIATLRVEDDTLRLSPDVNPVVLFRNEAARRGCDAVVMKPTRVTPLLRVFSDAVRLEHRGACIVYTAPSDGTAPPSDPAPPPAAAPPATAAPAAAPPRSSS